MNTDAMDRLRGELAAPPPDGFAALDAAQLEFLADALRGRRESQAAGLAEAAEAALRLVPGVARGPVRRILFR
ncbi:hypothetical protein [Streptomyces sp. RPT161]|uniref:hypothetical protein n=1 Tax=Streptomyces sp. RPT161 TaxID=3015993 RepID=UPI0022B8800F|nr:hypothetical protein [Streptomyces sp. RPT161]